MGGATGWRSNTRQKTNTTNTAHECRQTGRARNYLRSAGGSSLISLRGGRDAQLLIGAQHSRITRRSSN